MWISPDDIVHKPVSPPPSKRIPPALIADGHWDQDFTEVEDDIVFEAFYDRFVKDVEWGETGYVDFLMTDASEHGNLSASDARARCERIDELYDYIRKEGFKTQAQLLDEGSLIRGLNDSLRPPEYREIPVDIARGGEFLWHGGMHRLAIAKILDVDEIPVRINIRHEQWQEIREKAYCGERLDAYSYHPDIKYLLE
ncbi:hypothetical protein C496_19280 [Natronorubrum tibetense GA33]|uniref:ParB/Sulfiredoxin domain-containing protein n=1 Tax=Natronorubrum tibetense GA33 TaxID=1114856 RepID=L9VL43_9EURY|nr:hypothetical protein C496_19280 [Natronorubrum tibetense GA33]